MEDKMNLTKKQKLSWVEAHIGKELYKDLNNNFENSDDENINEFSSESEQDEIILADINETEEEEDDDVSLTVDVTPQIIMRHGRRTRNTRTTIFADFAT